MKKQSNAEDIPSAAEKHQIDPLAQYLRGLSRRTIGLALTVLPLVVLFNVGVLVWSLGGIDVSRTIVIPSYLLLAVALAFVPMTANALRLIVWARFLKADLSLVGAMRVMTGTIIANSVTPTTVGGMPLKLVFLMGEGIDTRRAVSMLSFQTVEDALVLFSLFGLCASVSSFALADFFAANPEMFQRLQEALAFAGWIGASLLAAAFAGGVLIAAGILGSRIKRIVTRWGITLRRWAGTVLQDWRAVVCEGKISALISLGLAFLQWSVRFSIAGLVIAAFGIDWQPHLYWLLQYLVQALSSFVPTPGAAGGAEAAFLLLFSPFVDLEILPAVMSAWRLLHFFVPLAGAALAFLLLRRAQWRLQGLLARGSNAQGQPAE